MRDQDDGMGTGFDAAMRAMAAEGPGSRLRRGAAVAGYYAQIRKLAATNIPPDHKRAEIAKLEQAIEDTMKGDTMPVQIHNGHCAISNDEGGAYLSCGKLILNLASAESIEFTTNKMHGGPVVKFMFRAHAKYIRGDDAEDAWSLIECHFSPSRRAWDTSD